MPDDPVFLQLSGGVFLVVCPGLKNAVFFLT
jgi:hypothetical protein